MARGRDPFREAYRIVETMQSGPGIARIDIHITIVPGKPEQSAGDDSTADLDRELAEFKASHGEG